MKKLFTSLITRMALPFAVMCCFTISLQAQTFDCPVDICVNASTATPECLTAVTIPAPIPTDSGGPCDGEVVTNDSPYATAGPDQDDASGDYPIGTTIVNYYNCNDEIVCTLSVEIKPTHPLAIVQPATFYVDENGEVVAVPSEFDNGSSDECGTIDSFALVGGLDFDCTDIGTTTVNVVVFNSFGAFSLGAAALTIADTIPPSCPTMLDVTTQLVAGECEGPVTFVLPTIIEDNCDDAAFASAMPGEPVSGDLFEVGTTTVNYIVEDASGNTAVCSFDVIVEEYVPDGLACLTNINLSIDAVTCQSVLTAEMLLTTTDLGCAELCTVTIMDEEGNELPNLFTSANVGQSYMYQVCCGGLCCMGTVNVEDKAPPMLECGNDTITCAQLVNFPEPMVTENCSNFTLTMLDETFEDVDCADPVLQQIIRREYQAVDDAGNISNTCIQTLSIAKFDIGTVEPLLNPIVAIECGSVYPTDANGAPDPVFYGSPRLGGANLWPGQFLICNLMVTFQDQTLQTSQNTTSIVRTWDATTWYCGQDSTRQFVQVFNIADTQGPILSCPLDATYSTSGVECSAIVDLPALTITDICGDVVDVDVQYEGGFIENSNGGLASLPNGNSTVTYIATDSNGNTNSCSFDVLVSDNEEPIPVCELYTTVGLTNDGTAIVDASAFDDGSFDACGPVTLEIRRMTPNCDPTDAVFGETVTFCCEDLAENQQVVLRVTDQSGNFNECMVIAEVQDKIPPTLIQGLPDITLSCEFPFNSDDTEQFGTIQMNADDIEPILLTADLVEFSGPATDGLVFGNCIELTSDEFNFGEMNNCGIGTVIRIITFTNAQGLTVSDVQLITFVNPEPFVMSDINFPNNYTAYNICDVSQTLPANLPTGFDVPTFTEDGCDQVGVTYKDKFIDASEGAESCYKIIRTWTLADWCQNENGTFKTFEQDQTIEIFNNIAPEITGASDNITQCSYDVECGPAFVELINSGTDDCTAEEFLKWTYRIDFDTDGAIDIVGNTTNASGTYPVGFHTITWILNDACGNEDMSSYTFEIQNCKAATPICFDNLTIGLTAMDTDNDGEIDTEMVMIAPDYFDGGSYHVCGTPVTLSFSADVNDTERMFNCDDIGEQPIELWVTDESGNQDFCSTTIDIQDNNDVDFCANTLTVNVTGELYTEDDEFITKVDVVLEGGETTDQTETDGYYAFMDMPTGGSYVVNPNKDLDHLNGITTLDIILIQKHILGLQILDSPYKMIAADVNKSDDITGQDIIQLRKLILGQNADFPDNTSWRFIDNDHTFIDPANPWIADIMEEHMITELTGDMIVDFTGVKIGDVNNSAQPNELVGELLDTRSNTNLSFELEANKINANETVWIPVYASNFEGIQGYQFGANFDPNRVEVLDARSAALTISESNFKVTNNAISMVWHNELPLSIANDAVLFELKISTKRAIEVKDLFTINDQVLRNESYDAQLQTNGTEISIRGSFANGVVEAQFILSQNEPNPWNAQTSISIESSITGTASFNVMDVNGKTIVSKTLSLEKGTNQVVLTNEELPVAGIFYYEVQMNEMKIMKKMVLLK
ncbi:HYR domain-containing protein [Saprospiraceae bacterium]|nr:HYR domain-containing protein [Saprospiraceae bacterium]